MDGNGFSESDEVHAFQDRLKQHIDQFGIVGRGKRFDFSFAQRRGGTFGNLISNFVKFEGAEGVGGTLHFTWIPTVCGIHR